MLKILLLLLVFHVCCGSIIKRSTDSFVLKNATQMESPWLALIKFKSSTLRCGGSLVNNKFIITAAHCFDNVNINAQHVKKEVKVLLGEWKTDLDPDCEDIDDSCEPVAEISAKKVVIHKNYKTDSGRYKHKHDIAIVQLAWAPRKSELIQNIDLTENECGKNYTGEELSVTGFGQIPFAATQYAKIKKSIKMLIQSDKYCGENQKDAYVRDYHMCGVGTEGETTCSGDSGSGLTSNDDDINRLEGIVVYGVPTCRDGNKPSGFVKVACFKDWIDTTIAELSVPKKRT